MMQEIISRIKENKSFDDIRDSLAQIENINRGGCGISALVMLRWLQENDIERFKRTKIIFGYYDEYDDDYKMNMSYLNDKGQDIGAGSHVFLKDDLFCYDCSEEIKINGFPIIIEVKDINFLIKSINNLKRWNPEFDRDEQISIIEEETGIMLNDVII